MKIIIIFIISLFFRLLYLGVVPASLSHDETDNIIQAHSIIQTGHDIESIWSPLEFVPNSGVMAELSPVINVPALSLLPNNLFTNRLTTALLSSIFPILVWYWLKLIGVETGVALVTAILISISPWHILTSRTAFEQPTSLFSFFLSWILLAIYAKPNLSTKAKIITCIAFIITYIFAFFTYHGYKFSMPILTSMLLAWHFINIKKDSQRKLLVIPLVVIIFLLARIFLYTEHYSSRSGELLFNNTEQYVSKINEDRRMSLAPNFLKSLYSNKPLKLLEDIRNKFIMTTDTDLLFIHGESNGVFSTWKTGYLYLITLPLLLLGLGYLMLTHKREHLLMLSLLLVSPIATTIHVNNSLVFRSGIYFVMLNIIIAYGLVVAYRQIERFIPKYRYLLTLIFGALLAISFSSFLYIYIFVTPVTNANAYFFGERLVANYIQRSPGKKILLIVSQPRYLYSAIQLSKSIITKADIESFGHLYSPTNLDEYFLTDLVITRGCPKGDTRTYDTIIVSKILLTDLGKCDSLEQLKVSNPKLNISSFVSPQDSGEEFRIFGDQLCTGQELSSFVHPTSHSDFKLESMSSLDFCKKWVVKQ